MRRTLLVLLTGLAFNIAAEDRFANVEIKTQPLTDQIYMLIGAGGNIGVSTGDDGILMIDDQFYPLAQKIKAALSELGDETPTFLLNTHYHGDHTGSNAAFGKDSTIVAHHNVRVRLINGDTGGQFPDHALPMLTFEKEVRLYFNGEEIRVIHMPAGHTDGDSVVHFTGSNVVHMGDHFFKSRFPYVDLGAGGSVSGLIQNIRTVLAWVGEDTKIIPGHGLLATRRDLKEYLVMLEATSRLIEAGVKGGQSEDRLIEAGLPKEYASWGSGFISEERWIKTLYASYQPVEKRK